MFKKPNVTHSGSQTEKNNEVRIMHFFANVIQNAIPSFSSWKLYNIGKPGEYWPKITVLWDWKMSRNVDEKAGESVIMLQWQV